MAAASGGTNKSARDVLEEYGEKIQQQAHDAAKQYSSELHGFLTSVVYQNDERRTDSTPQDPCKLDHIYHTNVTDGHNDPCGNRPRVRFSDTEGAQCDKSKIKGNEGKEGGACAPFRRLHLCDQHLSHMQADKINTKDNLLLEVLLAAKYEGQSITQDYPKYRATYNDSPSKMCTMLARSFADIGDIIRGKDLYRGNNGKDKLENNLKTIFAKIHGNLKDARTHYQDTTDFYQLREDWWTVNRDQVWKALTCNAGGSQYFRATCGGSESPSMARDKCRCDGDQVPTNFDYVPQYLRWFEEWAEDFCRKKKKKVQNLEKSCREQDKYGKDRYCSRNGYDCEKTIRKIELLRMGKQCISCLYACNPYVDWIEKQKEQFDKQKNKYDEEIKIYTEGASSSSGGRAKRAVGGTTKYEGYESKFYKELQSKGYRTVDDFLDLLSKENVCKEVKDDKGGTINFKTVNSGSTNGDGDGSNKTFSHTEYCQPCPICGVKREGDKWITKPDDDKCRIKLYRPIDGAKRTEIKILKSGDGQTEIENKLNAFCAETNSSSGGGAGGSGNSEKKELYDEWKCYQFDQLTNDGQKGVDDEVYNKEVETGGGLCILKKEKKGVKETKSQNNPDEIQKTFNPFFYYWVAHMLKDSIYWRTKKLDKCINNTNGKQTKCKNGCNKKCDCFKNWIEQKEKEWKPIKEHFYTQKITANEGGLFSLSHDDLLKQVLELEFSNENTEEDKKNNVSAQEAKEIKHLQKILKDEENEGTPGGSPGTEQKNIMDKLIDYEEDEADLCLEIHEDEEEDGGNDECDDDHEEPPIFRLNPCADKNVRKYPALATKAAHQIHELAKLQLSSRGGRRTLKADATKGEYNRQGKRSDLKGDKICNINTSYSNDSRGNNGEPCKGKDGRQVRFKIGTPWTGENKVNTTHLNLFMPPRREHMCTSNLEHLNTGNKGLSDGTVASHSLLGDVLLAAKYEADFIKKKYNHDNNPKGFMDKATICRAMKYSFADIGDIIRGRDLWNINSDAKDLQDRLEKIFKTINEKLPNEIQKRYTNRENKHLDLRKDWWEANRYQVWRAIKCSLKDMSCDVRGVPLDDYIPQRLRWMTEWAEWYCKEQSQAYETLQDQCGKCTGTNKDNCTRDNDVCNTCKNACDKYEKEIDTWKTQWTKIKTKYEELYLQAQTTVNNGKRSVFDKDDPDYQLMVDFLTPIHKASIASSGKGVEPTRNPPSTTTITPYSSAAGYIHQEIGYGGCQEQTQFCEYENGVTPTTGSGTNNKNYAFKNTPKDHDEACGCNTRDPKPVPKKVEEKKDACEIVGEILKDNNGRTTVGECNPKDHPQGKPYPGWDCTNTILVTGKGECMPPRRIKLCLYFLSHENERKNLNTQEDLRKAFIKCAAAETFLSWQYYKSKNGSTDNLDEQLKKGTIPPEFLRSMIYTFGDYRDICMDTDISKKIPGSDVSNAKDNIGKVFEKEKISEAKKDGKTDEKKREEFWKENGKEIWKGMLCALEKVAGKTGALTTNYTYANVKFSGDKTRLENFAEIHQFLRWFIEWGEDFCTERQKKENAVEKNCTGNYAGCNEPNTKSNDSCIKSCKSYQDYISDKKKEYNSQKKKFEAEKSEDKPEYNDISSKEAPEYLKDKCFTGTCNCMQKVKDNSDYWENYKKTYDNTTLQKKCECELPPKDACTIVKDLFEDNNKNKTYFEQACSLKYSHGKEKHTQWKCNSHISSKTRDKDNGSVCIPPRRQQMYIKPIETLNKMSPLDLRTAFIQSAAIETFFLWHTYKKQKEKKPQGHGVEGLGAGLGDGEEEEQPPQEELQSGKIPDDFLRQMFYTLGDYRDILFSGSKDEKSGDTACDKTNIVLLASENKQEMQKIQEKIKDIVEKPNGGTTPQALWSTFAQPIWNGMICALTYDTNTTSGTPPTQNEKVKTELLDGEGKPKKEEYQYQTAKLKEEASGEKKPPKLSDFVEIPTFFRYLHEWGQNFCKERKKRLEKIEGECTEDGEGDTQKYSGDGEYCKGILNENPGTFKDLGSSCPTSCRFYKKWIEKKKIEFTEQENAYSEQKKKCVNGSNNHGNEFCGTEGECDTAAKFLQKLGPCSKTDNDSGNGKTLFKDIEKTFEPAKDCKPCSEFKIDCKNGKCKSSLNGKCQSKITVDTFDTMGEEPQEVVMRVIDNDTNKNGFGDLKSSCENAHIFEGIKENKWECRKVCDVYVCKPKKNNNGIDDKQIILINALMRRWVEHFLEDYNKIKKKLRPCMKKENGNTCIQGCNIKCNCVKEWIEKKKREWKNIKERFNEQYKIENDEYFNVRSFLEKFQDLTEFKNAIKPCGGLTQFKGSCGLNGTVSSKEGKKNEINDVIDCLIKKLEDKIGECEKNQALPSGNKQCTTPPTTDTPTLEDEDELLEENENPVAQPKFCPEQTPPKQEEKGDCVPAKTEPEETPSSSAEEPAIPALDTESEKREEPPPQLQSDEPSKPIGDILSSTIPFGIAIALTSIVFLFLKKKTKSSVGNLFQILQIPKSDYDIPTLKSKNRYIPYRSGTYKGKTYIYMEGDSDEDKYAFMSDTTDVTSSESEYEELDINDIYVPHAPKYKTLIEVVLEPSKRDTQNDIHNDIPSDIPNSDTPPPITDDEWNKLKKDFISNMLQNTQNTEPNILRDNVDNNTHPTTSHHNVEEKPFIMSIHDRNLFSGEEYNYDMSTNSGNNDLYTGIEPTSANHDSYSGKHGSYSGNHHPYSGIDLINDALSGNHIDIYDELLKRKENELFGTNHPKRTSTYSVAKNTNSDPIHNQLDLFHTWLDRHRDMCEKLKNDNERLAKLKEQWENKTHSGDINSGIPSGNHVLNTDVSIQIDMDNLKPKNEFTNMDTNPDKSTMDTILDDLEKYNEPYYYDFYKDDMIYYDVHDDEPSIDDIKMEVPNKVQIEMNVVNNKKDLLEEEYLISDIWNI
ncbi:hypothetical protein C923_04158 [Plasmodium falciparum UGT5.1]|uniref:Duffy-binding-like domain-containing protein n=1 Tax=Plasmodium falciparum UGT5.1 TaxID=1237627 RepID=W7J949_PLAFA|nr:hypothetical protein C923_04158 [Plasmodium falciparum UGT5.1]